MFVLLHEASSLREWVRVLDQPEADMAIVLPPPFLLPPSCRRGRIGLWCAHGCFVSAAVILCALCRREHMVKGSDSLKSQALGGGRDKGLVCRFFSTAAFSGQISLCFHSCQNSAVPRQSFICINEAKQFFGEHIYWDYRSCKLLSEYNLKCLDQHVLKCT